MINCNIKYFYYCVIRVYYVEVNLEKIFLRIFWVNRNEILVEEKKRVVVNWIDSLFVWKKKEVFWYDNNIVGVNSVSIEKDFVFYFVFFEW